MQVCSQYASPDRLKDRLALHERYGAEEVPFHAWLFGHVQAPAIANVLEVGCGSGHLWRINAGNVPTGWRLKLSDASAGMLAEARSTLAQAGLGATFEQLSVDDLRSEDSAFDLAFANHMLYHAPNVDAAVAELRRVLRQGGRLYCATNGAGHMRQVQEERARLAAAVPELGLEPLDISGFSLETGGAVLARHFAQVEAFERRDTLQVTEVEPYVRYVLSLASLTLAEVIAARTDAAERFRVWLSAVEELFEAGPVAIDRVTGFFEAS